MSPSIRLSAIRFASLPISTSWFTRSKNFSRSTSTTTPASLPGCTAAPRTRRRARCAQVGSRGCAARRSGRIAAAAPAGWLCWMNRSSTVGIPSSRTPPPLFGISCLSHRLRLVGAREQLLADRLPVLRQVRRQLVHGHPVDAGTALVLLHSLQRRLGVAALDHPLHQGGRFLSARFRSSPSALRRSAGTFGASPLSSSGSSSCSRSSGAWRLRDSRSFRSPLRSALRARQHFRLGRRVAIPAGAARATTASADFSLRLSAASPFQA